MHSLIKRLLGWLGAILLVLYGLHKATFMPTDWLDNLAARCAYPFYKITGAITNNINSWQDNRLSYNALKKEHQQLTTDYNTAINELIAFRAEQHVQVGTQELSAFMARYNIQGVPAHIMTKQIDLNGHFYLVNAGSNASIKKDMVAIYQNHLVGRVVEAYPWYSKVVLITDEKSKVAGYTSKTHAPGIVQGYNQPMRCNFAYVSHLFQVLDHDLVISSGQGEVYPQGFCLGKIVLHNIKEKELYHHIDVQPVINLRSLSYVLLIDPKTIMQF
ncbi:rod shape-determining protein MreC [Candidatus Dependentiae bacterium]|nr:rod shape-determining protein MreC [Candidatus Dependentiae bacterium]